MVLKFERLKQEDCEFEGSLGYTIKAVSGKQFFKKNYLVEKLDPQVNEVAYSASAL